MNIPSNLVRRGLVGGYRCPISGKEFVSNDGRRDTKERLYREQQEHTAALMLDMDGGQYQARPLESYKAQYADYIAKNKRLKLRRHARDSRHKPRARLRPGIFRA